MHTHTHTQGREGRRECRTFIYAYGIYIPARFSLSSWTGWRKQCSFYPFPSSPWQILSFFLGLPQKAIKAKAQENSQENACLPINEICANVQESARNLARGQKPRRERAHKKWHTNQMCLGKNACEKVYKNKKTIQRHADTHTHTDT